MSRRRPSVSAALRVTVPPNLKYLVAVSGGMDSMALLIGMLEIQRLKKISFEVAHLDHGIRADSGSDAEFVETFCRSRSIPCHQRRLSSCPPNENFEGWARVQRYSFFAELLSLRGLDLILTAHTATDVAENLLMRLVSNKEANAIQLRDTGRQLLRPLLKVSRSAIEEYVALRSIPFRHDSTNDDTSYLRNRVRHVLVPAIREHFGAEAPESIGERAVLIADDERYLTELAGNIAKSVLLYEWGSEDFVAKLRQEVAEAPPVLEWRLFEEVLRSRLGFGVGHRQALEFGRFLRAGRGELNFAGGHRFSWHGGRISNRAVG